MSSKDNNLKQQLKICVSDQKMEFWHENQGQSPLYSKFGTVPGRNCPHNYHDRHQTTHYPLFYGEQQDPSRESNYWTVPGSRTGGAPQEYMNWTDQELNTPASSHFPFILDRYPQQHQELREYQQHEAREWTAAQRARDYERGFLREGLQRRWEPSSPVHYSREGSTKRSDSSYRELEAWAARYSHSLPRRRRIEAELRGASQGLLESSMTPERDSRSRTDPRMVALQHIKQSVNIRESGVCDRGGRQQATAYLSQTPSAETSHMLGMKGKTDYQRRLFSHPPGYIAPPPYNSPHKSSPVLANSDSSLEQEGKRQTYWPQSTLRKDAHVDNKKRENDHFTKPGVSQYTLSDFEGQKHQKQEASALQASSPTSIQKTQIQHEGLFSLQQPQVLQAVQSKDMNEEPTSKVIEGRKFRLNKKTGGLTIFCLVSRIAGNTETPSLPICMSQTNIRNAELGVVSQGLGDSGDNQKQKFADEVDFRPPMLAEQSNTSDVTNIKAQENETPICIENEILGGNLSNKAGKAEDELAQTVQPVSLKYPLWREPSCISRVDIDSSSTGLTVNTDEGELDVLQNQEVSAGVHPIEVEVRRLDIKKDTKSEDDKGLLVIDTTCVVVKMELFPSPKKEQVHYLDSTAHTEHSPLDIQPTVSSECVQSGNQLNEDVTTEQNAETDHLYINERAETELDLIKTEASDEGSDTSFPCMSLSSVSERETLEERAERILGIPLDDSITETQTADATSLPDLRAEHMGVKPPSIKDNDTDYDAAEQFPEDATEKEQSQIQLEVGQNEDAVCLQDNDDVKDRVANEGGEDFAGSQKQLSEGEGIDSQLKSDKVPPSKSSSVEATTEQVVENYISSQHSSPATNLSSLPSPDCAAPNPDLPLMLSSSDLTSLLIMSESNIEECPDPELIALNSPDNLAPYPVSTPLPQTPSQQLPSPLPSGSADFSQSSTPHTDHSPCPSPLYLINQTAEAVSGALDEDEKGETSQLLNSDIGDAFEDLSKDVAEVKEQFESGRPDNAACVKERHETDEQQTEENNKDPPDHSIEETLKVPKENATEVNISHQQLECLQEEGVACVEESSSIEEQLSKDVYEDPTNRSLEMTKEDTIEDNDLKQQLESYVQEKQASEEANEHPQGLLEQTIAKENITENQTEVKLLPQQFDNGQEEDAPDLKEMCATKELFPKQADEEPAVLLEQTISKENATDSVTQLEDEDLQDMELKTEHPKSSLPSPSDSDCEVSQSPLPSEFPSPSHELHKSDSRFVSFFEIGSAPNPVGDAAPATPEHVPPTLLPDSYEESLQFSSSSPCESPSVLIPSSSCPHEGSDLLFKEDPQYPMSLWDAVNRIRKHTAPDSENEEEEVSELWDPECMGEDFVYPDVVEDMDFERIVFNEAGQQEVSTEGSVEVGRIQRDLSRHAEDDTLSCSSTSSRGSGDTVIVADEVEEMPPNVRTESETVDDEEFQTAEGEQGCSGELKEETAAEEDDGDVNIVNESGEREEFPVKVVNRTTTKAAEMMETAKGK